MTSTLVAHGDGLADRVDERVVAECLEESRFFWLDLQEPSREEFAILREVFGFHPLAVEDSERFGQRAKIEEYGDFTFLVVFGWSPDDDGLVEVHCFFSERSLVTVRRDPAPAIDALRDRYARGAELGEPIRALYRIVDGLVDSFFPALADFDQRLDELGDRLLSAPTQTELHELMQMRRRLATLKRAVGPERDMLGQIANGIVVLPGLDVAAERFFRDVYDHLIRLGETIDSYRELTAGTMEVYLSNSSNRLNEVIKRLTLVATIFLPLTFVTGFFGQNFGWLVDHVGGFWQFFVLGIVAEALVIVALLAWFRHRGWV